jgi:hypothetical protein
MLNQQKCIAQSAKVQESEIAGNNNGRKGRDMLPGHRRPTQTNHPVACQAWHWGTKLLEDDE